MMKHFFLILCGSLISVITLFAQNDATTFGSYSCYKGKTSLSKLPMQPSTTGPHSFDVIKYTLNLNIHHCYAAPYPKDFRGSVKILFRADSAISTLKLNATGYSLQIDSVRLNATSFTHSGNILTVTLDHAYTPGQTGEIMIYYRHLNVDDFAFYAKNGFVFTDCEPEGARKWFPCYDSPSDKALLDLTVKTPSNVKLGSNGHLADSTKVGDTITYHWVTDNNIATYLIVMTSKVNFNLDIVYYHKITNPSDSVPIRFYYNIGEDPSPIEAIIGDMAGFYATKFCEHPFEKNGFATLNDQFSWGGMENQTLTSFCQGCWDESLTAHEFAHQWFGDMITCTSWADIWLNEGFASWSDAFWNEYAGGYSAYHQAILSYAGSYFSGNPGWALSVPSWATTTPNVNVLFNWSITYCKGACALHQIRYVLGDSLFFQVLQTYSADTNLKYKSAAISDFNQVVNDVTGDNYDWYFNDWIYQPNHPIYANTYQIKNPGAGSWQVDFNAKQVQSYPYFYRMLLNAKIRFRDNSDTVVRFMNNVNDELFSFYFTKEPTSVTFDPDNEIVLKKGSTTVGVPGMTPGKQEFSLGANNPNPLSSKTMIPFTTGHDGAVLVRVTNLLGNTVWEKNFDFLPAGDHQAEADLSGNPQGMYIYSIQSGGRQLSRKLIIGR
jgi:aminopeptidase N